MNHKSYTVAVVGATGVVGREMIRILQQRNFPVGKLIPIASERSKGKAVEFADKTYPVIALTPDSFKGVDIALFSAGGNRSREFAPIAASSGAVVIDNSNAFRMDGDVPLVVPEVNAQVLSSLPDRKIIANPNCSTIQLVVALAPLHRYARIRRVLVSTYQAVSGAGQSAVQELSDQAKAYFADTEAKRQVFQHRIAFNCIPHIDVFEENGFTREEMKVTRETKKIMDDQSIAVTTTAVRVPVFNGHSEAVWIDFESDVTPEKAREILANAPGITVIDDPSEASYPMAIDAAGTDPVYVGRIRRDFSIQHGLNIWIVADNLRKGAALNAVQIAEVLVSKNLI
jgi:aspartate-semialdehyde dehydrogenase